MQLGLCNPPDPIYLYVGTEEKSSSHWYQFDVNSEEQIPVPQRALAGYLKEVRLTPKEYKGKEVFKLDIVVSADEIYIIRTGIETNFAKSFLLAIAQVDDLTRPLIISCQSSQQNVVFCRIYDENKNRIKAAWQDIDIPESIHQIQKRLGQQTCNRQSLLDEIDLIIKKKNIPVNDCKSYAVTWTGKTSRTLMTDSELRTFRDRLSRVLP
jgi:hypothetical protein